VMRRNHYELSFDASAVCFNSCIMLIESNSFFPFMHSMGDCIMMEFALIRSFVQKSCINKSR
jgi:hypothetical protein